MPGWQRSAPDGAIRSGCTGPVDSPPRPWIAAARSIAAAIEARPDEIIFPASGPHPAQAAIAGLLKGRARVGRTVVTSTIDHSAVLSAADAAPGGSARGRRC